MSGKYKTPNEPEMEENLKETNEFENFTKEDYIFLINFELKQLKRERSFRLIYSLTHSYREEESL